MQRFQESRNRINNPYRNYYIWQDKPNNWESFLGEVHGKKDTSTNQFITTKLMCRLQIQLKNPVVANEIQKILQLWLNLGIDGLE